MPKRRLLNIYLPRENAEKLKDRIESAAKKEGRSISNFMLWLFERFTGNGN